VSILDLLEAWAELEGATPAYLEAEAYATGMVDEVFASSGKVAERLAVASRHYRFPLISVAVKARVNRCKLTAVKGETDTITERITEVWDANDMDVWYPELLEKTFMFGDAYLMVWPIADDAAEELETGSPADDELVMAGVEFTVHDPKHCRMLYDAENERRKRVLINRWEINAGEPPDDSKVWRVDLWYADTVEHWVSLKDGQLDTEAGWAQFEDEDPERGIVIPAEEENPTGEIPFFHHRTALPYGVPVHAMGYGAQNALTKMLCTQIDTSDSQGWPQRYRLLDPDAELDQNSDDPQYLDDEDAPVFGPSGVKAQGGTNTSLRTGAGTMQTYPGTKEVGQFDAADPTLFLGPAQVYIKIMATLTDTPAHHFYPEETPMGQAPSGAAFTKAEAPLIAAVQRLQTLQRGAVREEWTFGLQLLGLKVKPGTLDIQWEPVERATDLEDWQTVLAKQEAGVPVEQTLEEAGYTAEQAEEWQAEREKAEKEMRDQMIELAGNPEAQGKPPAPKPPAPAGAR
jgi:hypothetical protein